MWLAWTDRQNEGNFASVYNNSKTLGNYTKWKAGEPNGQEKENCVEFGPDSLWNDIKCDFDPFRQITTVCHLNEAPYYSLRGWNLYILFLEYLYCKIWQYLVSVA